MKGGLAQWGEIDLQGQVEVGASGDNLHSVSIYTCVVTLAKCSPFLYSSICFSVS